MAIGVDVGGTKTAVAVVDVSSGRVIDQVVLATEAAAGADLLMERVERAVAGLDNGRAASLRVGVAVPELVSLDGLVTTEGVVPGLRGDLVQRWSALGVRTVESDVRAAALAESRFGTGKGLPSFVFVSVGTGISHCFVVADRPWAGAHGAAILSGSGLRAATEGPGHELSLEEFAGGPGLVAAARAVGGQADTARDVIARCIDDPVAASTATRAGVALGLAMAEMVNLMDPHAVVVGGGLGSAPGPYWESALATARRMIWAVEARDVPLLQSALGGSAGVIGAALTTLST
jgi:glucokinase